MHMFQCQGKRIFFQEGNKAIRMYFKKQWGWIFHIPELKEDRQTQTDSVCRMPGIKVRESCVQMTLTEHEDTKINLSAPRKDPAWVTQSCSTCCPMYEGKFKFKVSMSQVNTYLKILKRNAQCKFLWTHYFVPRGFHGQCNKSPRLESTQSLKLRHPQQRVMKEEL